MGLLRRRRLLTLLALAACEAPPQAWTATATVDDAVVTLVHVAWEPPDADVTVEYADGRVATGAGTATLYGLPADTDVRWRLAHEDWRGAWRTTRTGSLPAELPTVEAEGTLEADYVLFSWQEFPPDGTGVTVVDGAGNIVWYWLPTGGFIPAARRVGDRLLAMHSAHDTIEDATIEWVPLDGGAPTVEASPLAHHDVIEVPGARYAAIVGEVRTVDGEAVVGDTIVEVGEDGAERVVWSAFDAFPVTRHEAWDAGTYTMGVDWTHANGLFYDEAEDAYYLSVFYLRCVVKIDRATGATEWVLGGDEGTLAIDNDAGSGRQHAPEWVDGELMFFDNGYNDAAGSRLVRYAVDEAAGTASRSWEWRHPDGLFSFVLGDVDVLPGGGHLSTWGNYAQVIQTDAEGEITWRAQVEPGFLVAQAETFTFP